MTVIPKIDQILYATDLSENSNRAFEYANEIPSCPVLVSNVVVVSDKPIDTILQHIRQSKCDPVGMGNRGHGLLKEALVGSTSRKVLKHSPKPVLIVPPVTREVDF